MMRIDRFLDSFFLLFITFAYGAGIVFSTLVQIALPFHLLLLSLLITTLLLVLKKNQATQYCILLCFFLVGWFNHHLCTTPPKADHHIYTIAKTNKEVVITGFLNKVVEQHEEHATLTIETRSYRTEHSAAFKPATGLITIRYQGQFEKQIAPGSPVICRTKLSIPRPLTTPGTFDYKNYLINKNIWVTGKITSPLLIDSLRIKPSLWDKWRYFPERVRARATTFIADHAKHGTAPLYQAILTGNKAGLSKELQEGFKANGISHILAISGLHLSILTLFMYGFFYFLLSRSEKLLLLFNVRKIASILTLFPLLFYVTLSGGNAPVLRAFIMAATAILAIITNRKKTIATLISFAALLILFIHPTALFTPSFQLSFAAIIAILAGSRLYVKALDHSLSPLNRLKIYVGSGLLISLLANMGTAPLLLFYFNRISFIGPLANLLIEPLICMWSLPLGFLALVFDPVLPSLGKVLLHLGSSGILLSTKIILAMKPLSDTTNLWLPTPSLTTIFLYYGSLIILFLKGKTRLLAAIPLLISLFLFFYPVRTFQQRWSDKSTISVIDVGQGSSTLIATPQGKNILIDGGGGYSTTFNVGERIIAPYLWHLGIKKLDQILITHPDSDHYNGISFLLEHFTPDILWISEVHSRSYSYNALLSTARQKGIAVKVPDQTFFSGKNWSLTTIDHSETENSDNDSSLVVRYRHQDFSMLFPGDISHRKEASLIKQYGNDLQATVLLSPHHGSKYSNSVPFLRTVSPTTCIISSGKSRHFPAPATLKRLAKLHIPFLETKKAGTILLETNGEKEPEITQTLP